MSADQAQETYKKRSGAGLGPHGLGKVINKFLSLNLGAVVDIPIFAISLSSSPATKFALP